MDSPQRRYGWGWVNTHSISYVTMVIHSCLALCLIQLISLRYYHYWIIMIKSNWTFSYSFHIELSNQISLSLRWCRRICNSLFCDNIATLCGWVCYFHLYRPLFNSMRHICVSNIISSRPQQVNWYSGNGTFVPVPETFSRRFSKADQSWNTKQDRKVMYRVWL